MIREGWTTFPIRPFDPATGACSCGNPKCEDQGKHPAVRWGTDHLAAGTQLPIPPGYGVGLATGARSGVVIVDVDMKDGKDGWASLQKLGPIPPTLMARTPTGGAHLYYQWPGFFVQTNSNVLGDGIDVRGDYGYAVLPPSPHKCGGRYGWVDPDAEVVDAPSWLLERFLAWDEARQQRKALSPAPDLQGDFAELTLEQRRQRAAEYLKTKPGAVEGRILPGERYSGGTMTFVRAGDVVRGHALPPAAALEVMQEWNARCSPPWDAAGLRRKIEEAYQRGEMVWGAMLPHVKGATEGFVTIPIDRLLAPVPEPDYHVKDLGIAQGRPCQLVGMGFSGKTIIAQAAAVATVTGTPLWGAFPVKRGPVGWLDFEMGANPLLRRFRRLARGVGARWEDVATELSFVSLPKTKLSSEDAEKHLLRFADGLTVCFVDSLRRATPGVEENDSDIAQYIDQLLRVSELTGCVFWFLHHSTTKTKFLEGQDARGHGRGSSAIYDSSGTVLAVSGKASEPMLVQQTRCGEGSVRVEAFTLTIEDTDEGAGLRVVHGKVEKTPQTDLDEGVLEAVKTFNFRGEAAASVGKIRELVGRKQNDVQDSVKQLIEQGRLTNLGTPTRPRYWVLDEDGSPWRPGEGG